MVRRFKLLCDRAATLRPKNSSGLIGLGAQLGLEPGSAPLDTRFAAANYMLDGESLPALIFMR